MISTPSSILPIYQYLGYADHRSGRPMVLGAGLCPISQISDACSFCLTTDLSCASTIPPHPPLNPERLANCILQRADSASLANFLFFIHDLKRLRSQKKLDFCDMALSSRFQPIYRDKRKNRPPKIDFKRFFWQKRMTATLCCYFYYGRFSLFFFVTHLQHFVFANYFFYNF